MTVYYVDDGGSSTAPYDTWAKAAANWMTLENNVTFSAGDTVYIGHDSADTYSYSGNATLVSDNGVAVAIISATQGSNPPTYQAATANQIDTSAGAYSVLMRGHYLYGVKIKSGSTITLASTSYGLRSWSRNVTLAPAANSYVILGSYAIGADCYNLTVDLTADGTTNRSGYVIQANGGSNNTVSTDIYGLSFVNAAYRTGTVFGEPGSGPVNVSGADFSGFTNATACEIVQGSTAVLNFHNCLTASTWTPAISGGRTGAYAMFTNCGPADAPTYLHKFDYAATCTSTTSIYRTGGATVEGEAVSWLITMPAGHTEHCPFQTPWIYGTVSSTGSKTFDIYITNDSADFTDAEVWMELEYLKDADEAQWTLASDQRSTITTTPVAQTDDTSSTWNGTGPSFTYRQKLSTTVTIGETGQYRARVAVGKASIASSAYFYVDPKVLIT